MTQSNYTKRNAVDDIVEELHNEADGAFGEARRPSDGICFIMRTAAAEIERLRELIFTYVNARTDEDHEEAWYQLVKEAHTPRKKNG